MPTGIETPKITPRTFAKTEYVRVPSKTDATTGDKSSEGNLKNPTSIESMQERQQAKFAQANLDATKARADIPGWALGLSVVGFAAGLIYANKQGSGFWGYVGYGIVGNIIFSVPYTFYYYSNLQKK